MRAESVAMTSDVETELREHLLRADGQEDVCLAMYATSTGRTRTSRLIVAVALPVDGEREVHGNASFSGSYVMRVAAAASRRGLGVALLHSHPRARGWQGLSAWDHDAERSYARLATTVTGLPLVGMTLAGDGGAWSARVWHGADPTWARSVRTIGTASRFGFNDALAPAPTVGASQERTMSAWGAAAQADVARMSVLVVGVGSVGLDIAQRLAATGIQHLGVMDPDVVRPVNLDRMVGATRRDARRRVKKVAVADRLMRAAATSDAPRFETFDLSICSPEGLAAALDFDVIFSCVDRPWPRAVLNAIAYADLIPVIDGGLSIEAFGTGAMRGATWRAQAILPGVPCLACSGQLVPEDVPLDQQGLLDDPEYIRQSGRERVAGRPNVALLSASVSAAQLALFVSLVAAPGRRGVPGPLRYSLAPHVLEHMDSTSQPYCAYEQHAGSGDARVDLTRVDVAAALADEASGQRRLRDRVSRLVEILIAHLRA